MVWLLICKFFFSLMMALGKYLGTEYSFVQLNFMRSGVVLLFLAPVIWWRTARQYGWSEGWRGYITPTPLLQVVRVLFAVTAMTCFFYAYLHLPLAQATVIQFVYALILPILSFLFLGERAGWRRWLAILLGYVGVLITTYQDLDVTMQIAAAVGILATLCNALSTLFAKKVAAEVRPSVFMFYSAVGTVTLLGPWAARMWVHPSLRDLCLMVLLSGISFVGQYGFYRAYRSGTFSVLAPVEYSKLIFASLFGILFFNEWPTLYTLLGGGLIVVANLVVARLEWRKS